MRFGKLRPDPKALAAARTHTFGAQLAPKVLDRRSVNFTPGLYKNDVLSDCTCVSVANMINAKSALEYFQTYIEPQKVVDFFADAAGNPADLTAVDGLVYLDVMNRTSEVGFDTGHDKLYSIPGTVNLDRNSLAVATSHLGSVGIGITLTQADMQNTSPDSVLDTLLPTGDPVGGHAVITWDYLGLNDIDLVRIGTWGYWQHVTWRWIDARIDEAHAATWPQLKAAS